MGDPSSPKRKRVTIKGKCENENIKAVLRKLFSKVVGKDHKTAQKIEQALLSLSRYPLEISSGEGCYILQGFDKNLCRFVDEQLFNERSETTVDNAQKSLLTQYFEAREPKAVGIVDLSGRNRCKSNKGTHTNFDVNIMIDSILIALHKHELANRKNPRIDINQLMYQIKDYTTQNMTVCRLTNILDSRRNYIRQQVRHDGVVLYCLTDVGDTLVHELLGLPEKSTEEYEENGRVPYWGGVQYPPESIITLNSYNDLIIDMPANFYDVVMYVDKNEPAILATQAPGAANKSESRSLKVGDVIWVLRSKITGAELVLPFIIERKRMDDYAASIKDGRFHEQKFRLRKSGLRNVIYLLEDHQGNKRCGLPMATLNQASANTRVQDGFMIHHTDSIKGTKRFLDLMTTRLTCELKGIHLRGTTAAPKGGEYISFEYFNASSSKTKPLTVKEMFIKMLLQLKGLSVEKALAITNKYSSPMALMNAYDECDEEEGELLLANLKFNAMSPRVTPSISKVIYMMFGRTF